MLALVLAFLIIFSGRAALAANAVDSLKPGEWYQVPNSKLSAVAPSPLPPGSFPAVVTAWSGGAFDTKRNQLIVWGGGHSDYAGNEVYAFSVDNLKWTRITNPSTDVGGDESTGLYPDGNPRSRHTYNYIQYVPSIDRFCSLGGATMYPSANYTTTKVSCLNLDTKTWELRGATLNPAIGNISGYDAATGLVWMESAGQTSFLSSWNPVTNVWTKWAAYNPTWFQYTSTGAVGNHHFVAIGNAKVYDWDLSAPQNQVQVLATTGGDSVITPYCPGFQFHPPSGNFIGWAGGKSVYSLNLATRTWSKIAIASTNKVTPTSQPVNGTFGRFQYVPGKDAFICVNGVSEDVFIFKYGNATTTTTTPPPTTSTPPPTTTTTKTDTVRIYLHDTLKVYIKQLIRITPDIRYDTTILNDTSSYTYPADTTVSPVVVAPPPATDTTGAGTGTTGGTTTPPPTTTTGTRLLTTVKVKNTAAGPQGQVPVTFGQVLKAGDLKAGETLRAFIAGRELRSQFDLKAVHNDGSARHGVMSFIIDTLGMGQEAAVDLMAGPPATSAALLTKSQLPSAFDANLTLKIGGVAYSVSLKNLIASLPSKTWLTGGEVNEFIVSGPLKNSSGAADPHLNAVFAVRQYKANVRVDLALENTWTYEPNPQGYIYDVDYKVGGKQALALTGVRMPHQTRWRCVSWYGGDVKTALTFDKKYLMGTGAFPYYDISLVVPEATLASFGTSFPLMSTGNINPYMPETGAQDGIGPLPRWSAAYLVSMDDRMRQNVLANGEAAGAFGIHYKDKNTGYPVTIDDYPYITLLGNLSDSYDPATGKYEMPPVANDTLNKLTPDDAHQPSLAYVPYAVTGDYFFLEELQYWANYNMVMDNPGYRGYKNGLLNHKQTRATAWSMRTLAQAAYITPDAHPLKSYFTGKLGNNLSYFASQYVNGPLDNHIGYYYDNAYAPYGFAPWQDNFLTFSIGYANQLGFVNAKPFFDFKSKLSVSMFTDSVYCWLQASAYSLQHADASGKEYPSVAAIYRANFPTITSCSGTTMMGYPDSPTGYGANLQPALAVSLDNNEPLAATAWSKYQTRSPKQYYNDSPQFDVIPKSVLDPMLK